MNLSSRTYTDQSIWYPIRLIQKLAPHSKMHTNTSTAPLDMPFKEEDARGEAIKHDMHRSLVPLRPKLTVVIEESTSRTREEQKVELRNLKSMQVEGCHTNMGSRCWLMILLPL